MRRLAHALALVTAAVTFVLILFGGLVTNTGAALAVPDWPTTFGHNMFLYPWSKMVGGIFYEHSHRLIGALVGLLTVALGAALWPRARPALARRRRRGHGRRPGGPRRAARRAGAGHARHPARVSGPGLLRAARRRGAPARPARGRPSLRGLSPATRALTIAAAALVYLQIVFGALLTHAGPIDLHLAGALAVFALAPIVTARLRRTPDPVAARGGAGAARPARRPAPARRRRLRGRFSPGPLPGGLARCSRCRSPIAWREPSPGSRRRARAASG